MRSWTPVAAIIAAVAFAGCSSDATTTAPQAGIGQTLHDNAGDHARHVLMVDMCDPTTFNEALGDGTCTNRDRGITFDQFNEQLARLGRVPTWRFTPGNLTVL